MPGFPGSSLGSGGWGLRCQELMRSSFYFILFIYLFLYFILFIFSFFFFFFFFFLGLLGFSPCIYIYLYIHSGTYLYIYISFYLFVRLLRCLLPGLPCLLGGGILVPLVVWFPGGVGAGVRRGRLVWDFSACLSRLEEINHSMLGTHLSFSLAFLPGLFCPLVLFSFFFIFVFTVVIANVDFFLLWWD